MEEIPEEEKNYFRNLERRFWKKYNNMSEVEREMFDEYVLNNAGEWLKIGGFTHKSEEDKRNFVDFIEMFSLVEIKPEDDTFNPVYVNRVIKRAIDYVKYKKEKKKKEEKKKKGKK